MLPLAHRALTRWQAAGLHLCASFTLALLAGLLIFGVWYPQPYTQAAGADRLVMLLIGIDLALGPLLTLIVYKHGKRGMLFDIAFIAVVQFSALIYGLSVISESRPTFVVVTRDMTYLTMASELDDADLAAAREPQYQQCSWTGPVLVAAPQPESAEDRNALLTSGMAGRDINVLPKYFRPFADQGATLINGSLPLQRLLDLPATADAIRSFVAEKAIPIERLRFQPLRGRNPEMDMTVVFDSANAAIIGVVAVDPWPAIDQPAGDQR